MTDTSYKVVPQSTGPAVRIIRVNIGGTDVDMQVVVTADVIGSDGTILDMGSWAHTFSYNTDGTIALEQVTNSADIWRQTWTWSSGNLTALSAWVKQ